MKKGKMTIKASRMFALLLVLTASLLVCSCKIKKCKQDYSQLSVMEFHSLDSANLAMDAFLNEFNGNERCSEYCTKVTQMKNMFGEMRDLFSDVDGNLPKDRYCAFVSMTKSNNDSFRDSPYETVRLTWNYLVRKKKDIYAEERLDLIEESEFGPKLVNYAKELARQMFGTQFNIVRVLIANGEIKTDIVDGRMAKRGACIVYVHMEGKFSPVDCLKRHTILKYSVEGTFKLSESDCQLVFAEGDYNYKGWDGDDPGRPKIMPQIRVDGQGVRVNFSSRR